MSDLEPDSILRKIFPEEPISYYTFIETALYHPSEGYYQKARSRVGRDRENDFYTSRSLQGQVFDRLLLAGAQELHNAPADQSHWVEIGIEPYQDPIGGTDNPFAHTHACPLPCTFEIPDQAVVFFNEILDAQPFHRFLFYNNQWEEIGVIRKDHQLSECILSQEDRSMDFDKWVAMLPEKQEEGYLIDLPSGSINFLDTLGKSSWKGTIITFDYGKRSDELLYHTPKGTARTYCQHELGNDLLARPTEEDITCHVWWDPLLDILKVHGFTKVELCSQESFFMNFSSKEIEKIISKNPGQFSEDKQTLHQLLHPANMGQKFQALVGNRF